jgi:hypothetical protein
MHVQEALQKGKFIIAKRGIYWVVISTVITSSAALGIILRPTLAGGKKNLDATAANIVRRATRSIEKGK